MPLLWAGTEEKGHYRKAINLTLKTSSSSFSHWSTFGTGVQLFQRPLPFSSRSFRQTILEGIWLDGIVSQ